MTKRRLLPYELIAYAAKGDAQAIDTVLRHYQGYILSLCRKQLYDANGGTYLCINEDMKQVLETKLLSKILTFRMT